MFKKTRLKTRINRSLLITVVIISITLSIGCVEEKQTGGRNMRISSPAFENNGFIPSKYTCDGENISPPLIISNVPEETKSLALIMDDPDAPLTTFVHWLVWNIPPNITEIPEGEKLSYPQGKNSFGRQGYGGPCPPFGTHRYFFKLYALDTVLKLEEGAKKKQLLNAMSGHILEDAELLGRYSRI